MGKGSTLQVEKLNIEMEKHIEMEKNIEIVPSVHMYHENRTNEEHGRATVGQQKMARTGGIPLRNGNVRRDRTKRLAMPMHVVVAVVVVVGGGGAAAAAAAAAAASG